MTRIATSILAGVLLAHAGAQGATRIDTAAFSMQYGAGNATGDMHLLSAEPDGYRIALDSIGNDIAGWSASGVLEAVDAEGRLVRNASSVWGEYAFQVAQGYRITGFTWSGLASGGLEAAWHDGESGIAASALWLDYRASVQGTDTPLGGLAFHDLAGVTMLSFSAPAGVRYGGDFTLAFSGGGNVQAQGIAYTLPDGTPAGATSIASVGLHDMVLTVHVSPVPEPGTWAMLLAGFAGLGMAARRRGSGLL